MSLLRHGLLMWAVFILLFTLSTFGLELLEGNKIMTTEYYGWRNIGITFIFLILLFNIVPYLVSFLPVTLLANLWIRPLGVRLVIYMIAGGLYGLWMFQRLYGHWEGYLAEGYALNRNSSIILFGSAGILYGILDQYFKKYTD
ncbi:hypothetical protein SAMN05216378_5821 [Paenibacillus catalpae]|uniref:Uncharacterized protein n=1 Tax=Paenibacillus catalpae TaxID=1045775 RepID=A0A1I2HID9_9BACL|nr:hypothetical protein [Paenibacillus catalpae]SFF29173.1 hypothetical protein SAMN05216378_5821 [Paenibacillus catalpae]